MGSRPLLVVSHPRSALPSLHDSTQRDALGWPGTRAQHQAGPSLEEGIGALGGGGGGGCIGCSLGVGPGPMSILLFIGALSL